MPHQSLTLKLDGITAADYLAWCRDPEPPALGYALRSIHVEADPLGDTITAILDWNQPVLPSPRAAAAMAGLSLLPSAHVDASPTDVPRTHTPSRLDQRLAPRVQRIHDLFAQVHPLDRSTPSSQQNHEPVTTIAA